MEYLKLLKRDTSQRPSGNQYKKLKVKGLAWKDFCEKLGFSRPIMLIKKELLMYGDVFFDTPLDIKKKFDDLLDSTLGIEFSTEHRNLNSIRLGWKISRAIVFYVIRKDTLCCREYKSGVPPGCSIELLLAILDSIIPSELVFKVGRTTGLTKGSIAGDVLMDKIELNLYREKCDRISG
ncbi:6364_t:CDS:2 [Funneliformis mosseae]|uniref:6364_t:CDS:1 n=1 Tax=Funneliformis mosseae TaxID=27381 RepID=A0A9N9B7W5_FUNMO|nr:6364_t:CDS:2 [Funneliformis mosseae]